MTEPDPEEWIKLYDENLKKNEPEPIVKQIFFKKNYNPKKEERIEFTKFDYAKWIKLFTS